MNDQEFERASQRVMAQIEEALEACGADLDFELGPGGVLEIEFADGSKMVVNRHGVNREIWVAARAGGFHFAYDGSDWLDTRDREGLWVKLSRLVSEQLGQPVQLLGV